MPSKIDTALQEKLHVPGDWPLNVEVEFSQEPPANELEALGLQHDGLMAWGLLSRQRIEGLALIPEVVAIRLSNRPAPAPAKGKPRIGANLQLELLEENRDEFHVAVRFSGPVKSPADFPDLTIHMGMGTGRLNRKQVQELAQRDDVVSIDSIPQVHTF